MKKNSLKTNKILALGFWIILLSGAVAAQTFTGPGFTIIDNNATPPANCSTVPVSGITTNTRITSFRYTNLVHNYLGDVGLIVFTPAGVRFDLAVPPDLRSCNYNGTYSFADTGASSVDAATAGCASATNLASGVYRSSIYGGGTANGAVTSINTTFGNLTPAQANGNWLVCALDFADQIAGSVGGTSITFVNPTAATVSVSGRVMAGKGRGLLNATVTITDSRGVSRSTRTSTFGYYHFADVAPGETYFLRVTSKRYQFAPQAVTVNEDLADLNFAPQDFGGNLQ